MGGCVIAPVAWASGPSALASRGHGPFDVVGPVAPSGRASGRGYAGVYTDRRKRSLGATTARMQNAPFGHVAVASLVQNALFRDVAVASLVQNALFRGVAGTECAFP